MKKKKAEKTEELMRNRGGKGNVSMWEQNV